MIEQVFQLAQGDAKTIEKVVMDENLHYMHMILNRGEALPEHFSNSNVYMAVLRGTLTIGLAGQEDHVYPKGALLKIPVDTKMNVRNLHGEVLELIVVKAPAPKK
ncbi:MAG: cupin domain-containing protein [candidate division Zixibacteria bacterium]|nr:cupin domain-containing protein [candidate division Zixibacteria bacterium]